MTMSNYRNKGQNWQDSKELSETNLHMLNNEILCDISFLVGNNEENSWEKEASSLSFPPLIYQKLVKDKDKSTPRKILAHRVILVSRSSVFEKMFVTDMIESKKGVDDPITVVDIDPDIFKEMLLYIYGDTANVCNENVFRLWYAARKYMMPYLETLCVEHLLQNLTCSTVCTTLEHCLFFDCDMLHLKQHCLRFICLELLNIPDTDYFQLSHCALNEIISQEAIRASEQKLYWICRKWAESRVEELGYVMTVACKICGEDYNVARSELEILCSASGIRKLMRSEKTGAVDKEAQRKHKHSSSTKTAVSKKYKHSCEQKLTAEPSENSSGSNASVRQSLVTSLSSLAQVKAARSWIAQTLAARSVGAIYRRGSRILVSLWRSLFSTGRTNQDDVCRPIEDLSESCPPQSRSDKETNSTENNSVACTLFKCGHIPDDRPQNALYILTEETDVSKTAAMRQILGDVFYKIRFPTMPVDYFSRWLGTSSILTDEEKVSIYYDITMWRKGLHYIPKDDKTAFNREPRCKPVTMKVSRFNAMSIDESDDVNGGQYVGSTCVPFRVSAPIMLEGVEFYTGASSDCEPFKVEITVEHENEPISRYDATISPLPDKDGVQAVNFFPHLYILAHRWYDIDCAIHKSRGARFFGEDGFHEVVVDPNNENAPEFRFAYYGRHDEVKDGQVASLLFSYL